MQAKININIHTNLYLLFRVSVLVLQNIPFLGPCLSPSFVRLTIVQQHTHVA